MALLDGGALRHISTIEMVVFALFAVLKIGVTNRYR
jgi:hypothetical protein